MGIDHEDGLPFGMRPGINDNLVQPTFRDGPDVKPRRLWPILVSIAVGLLALTGLVVYAVLT